MNEHSRAALFHALADLADRYPHWRLGQLVSNVAGWADAELWDVEDEQLLTAADLHLDQLPSRPGQAVKQSSPRRVR